MLEGRIEPLIKNTISKAFKDHSVENQALEQALSDAFLKILADHTMLEELAKAITEIQEFNERRRSLF